MPITTAMISATGATTLDTKHTVRVATSAMEGGYSECARCARIRASRLIEVGEHYQQACTKSQRCCSVHILWRLWTMRSSIVGAPQHIGKRISVWRKPRHSASCQRAGGWQYCANNMAGKLSHPWIHAKTGKADQSEEASAAYPWIPDYRNNGS